MEPEIFEIERVETNWQEAEQFWIAYFKAIGARIVNATSGGDGIHGHRHSSETKARMSEAALRASPDLRKRRGDAVRKTLNTPESQERLRAAAARRYTPELLEKMCRINKANANTPEARERTRRVHSGKTLSAETRAKISASRLAVSERLSEIARQREFRKRQAKLND